MSQHTGNEKLAPHTHTHHTHTHTYTHTHTHTYTVCWINIHTQEFADIKAFQIQNSQI
jgi:hypothetical protein